jgi:hypothetical protein
MQRFTMRNTGKPILCDCGRIARAFCVRCDAPLCSRHEKEWVGDGVIEFADLPESAILAMKANRLPEDGRVLCAQCTSECYTVLAEIDGSVHDASKQGRACKECYTDQVFGLCLVCGFGLCSKHCAACEKCNRLSCNEHLISSGIPSKLCKECTRAAEIEIERAEIVERAAQEKQRAIQGLFWAVLVFALAICSIGCAGFFWFVWFIWKS